MVEALGAGGAQAGAVTCPLSDWLLEMWAMKQLSATEVLTTCLLKVSVFLAVDVWSSTARNNLKYA